MRDNLTPLHSRDQNLHTSSRLGNVQIPVPPRWHRPRERPKPSTTKTEPRPWARLACSLRHSFLNSWAFFPFAVPVFQFAQCPCQKALTALRGYSVACPGGSGGALLLL